MADEGKRIVIGLYADTAQYTAGMKTAATSTRDLSASTSEFEKSATRQTHMIDGIKTNATGMAFELDKSTGTMKDATGATKGYGVSAHDASMNTKKLTVRPAAASNRGSILSERRPASGATMAITAEWASRMKPAVCGEKPMLYCR